MTDDDAQSNDAPPANTQDQTQPTPPAPPSPPENDGDVSPADMDLETYCRVRSLSDKRIELIAAFHNICRRDGIVEDTKSGFDARFAAFVVQPA